MLKTLGAQVKQYRWVTFITPVFSALEAVAEIQAAVVAVMTICSCRC